MNSKLNEHFVYTYLISILSLSIVGPISFSIIEIPLTLQTFVLCVTAYLFGWSAFVACLSYIVLGLLGLPIFSGFVANPQILHSTSAGFVLAFPIMVLVVQGLKQKAQKQLGLKISLFVFAHIALIGVAFFINSLLHYSFVPTNYLFSVLLPSLLVKSVAAAIFVTFIRRKSTKRIS